MFDSSAFNPIRLPRRMLRALARLVIGALLFAQLAVSAHACPQMAAAEQSATMATPAHQGNAADAGMVCGEHCKSGQQSDQPNPTAAPALLLRSVLHRLPVVPDVAAWEHRAAGAIEGLALAEPAHAILHCVFRI